MCEATAYAPVSVTKNLCDFERKTYNLQRAQMSQLIADSTVDKKKFVADLNFYTRVTPTYNDPDLTFEELVEKVRHTRYVAYNMYDRE